MASGDPAPPSVGTILSASLSLYRENFRTLALCALVVVAPLVALEVAIASLTGTVPLEPAGDSTPAELDGPVLAGQLLSLLFGVLLYTLGTAACLRVVIEAHAGRATDWAGSLRFGARWLVPLLLTALLVTACLVPAFLALLVPGIWLAVAWSLATPALVVEDLSPVQAMKRSFALVKGAWWRLCGALVLVALISAGIAFLVTLPVTAVRQASDSQTLEVAIAALAEVAGSTLSLPIGVAVVTLFYFDLRTRREGWIHPAPGASGEDGVRFRGFAPPAPPESA